MPSSNKLRCSSESTVACWEHEAQSRLPPAKSRLCYLSKSKMEGQRYHLATITAHLGGSEILFATMKYEYSQFDILLGNHWSAVMCCILLELPAACIWIWQTLVVPRRVYQTSTRWWRSILPSSQASTAHIHIFEKHSNMLKICTQLHNAVRQPKSLSPRNVMLPVQSQLALWKQKINKYI